MGDTSQVGESTISDLGRFALMSTGKLWVPGSARPKSGWLSSPHGEALASRDICTLLRLREGPHSSERYEHHRSDWRTPA